MLKICAKCQERKATVHFTMIDGEKVSKIDLCEECAGPDLCAGKRIDLHEMLELLKPGAGNPDAIIKETTRRTDWYPPEVRQFTREALELCLRQRKKPGHVSGRELLEALRELAIQKFGKRAKAVLAEWRIFRTEDFGVIVFEMIDSGALSKQPGDTKEEFQNGFDFDEAFPEE
jgi:uncharacterized repeat protein (TIGR04138 family)